MGAATGWQRSWDVNLGLLIRKKNDYF